jgi:BirA family transcriptional regulator, biotin operon repressor / biotin---[acetyl-CoA-carboxylase] ligase
MKDNDFINPDLISSGLKAKLIGAKIIHFLETDSTNTRAQQYALDGCQEGTVITAESQTKGRGRRNRDWYSPHGKGIYMSVILYPRISLKELPKITLAAAVAATEALQASAGIRVEIKWPNDLLMNNKKICGILTELNSLGNEKNVVIVGIGINVNTPLEMFPADIADIATSILIETKQKIPRPVIIKSLIENFDHYYEIFLNGGFNSILDKWKDSSNIVGRKINVKQAGAHVTGTVVDVDMDGALLVRDNDGVIQTIYSGDISYI